MYLPIQTEQNPLPPSKKRADMAPVLKGGEKDKEELPLFPNFGKGFNMRTVINQVEQAEGRCWVHYPRDMRIKQWIHRKDRVVLLGAGAYSMAPLPLHEAGLPIEDAAVLAQSLARSTSVADALAAYTTRRQPRIQAAQDWAWHLHTQAPKSGTMLGHWWMRGPGRLAFSYRHSTFLKTTTPL